MSYIVVKQCFRPAVDGEVTMDKVEETYVLEITQVFTSSSAVTDKRKLKLTREDVNTIRSLLDQLNDCQQKLHHVLAPLLQRHKVDVDLVTLLQFPELRRSFIDRDTDAGILKDDLQQFRMFQAAMRLVTKSVEGRRRLELSDTAQSLLSDMTSMIWKVLTENDISLPEPPRSGHLEEDLNQTTKEFLEFVGEQNKENVLTAEMTIEDDYTDNKSADLRAIYDVRNYVIVQELGSFLLLNFQRDLSHLI